MSTAETSDVPGREKTDVPGHEVSDAVWQSWRRDMPIADRFAYLDHAAVGPLYGPSAERIHQFADQAATLGDTVWPTWNARLAELRDAAGRLLDCPAADIATVPNTTAGINLVAEGFDWRPGDNVVLPDHEFPSNLFPWLNQQSKGVEVRRVPRRGPAGSPGRSAGGVRVEVDDLIDACDSKTRLIAASWVGYASGFRIDVDGLVDAVHRRGIRVMIDAIQGLGMYPLSIADTPVDFLIADGHKWLLGPEGFGVAMIRHEVIETLRPTSVGWASVKNGHNYSTPKFELKNDASRFESGSGNLIAASALSCSMKYFADIGEHHGRDAIANRVIDLADRAAERLRAAGARIDPDICDLDVDQRHRSGIVTFTVPGVEPSAIRTAGLRADVVTSCRGGGVRAAFHAYNNDDDIERLVDVVRTAAESTRHRSITDSPLNF